MGMLCCAHHELRSMVGRGAPAATSAGVSALRRTAASCRLSNPPRAQIHRWKAGASAHGSMCHAYMIWHDNTCQVRSCDGEVRWRWRGSTAQHRAGQGLCVPRTPAHRRVVCVVNSRGAGRSAPPNRTRAPTNITSKPDAAHYPPHHPPPQRLGSEPVTAQHSTREGGRQSNIRHFEQ